MSQKHKKVLKDLDKIKIPSKAETVKQKIFHVPVQDTPKGRDFFILDSTNLGNNYKSTGSESQEEFDVDNNFVEEV
jgi:hypothetical protein